VDLVEVVMARAGGAAGTLLHMPLPLPGAGARAVDRVARAAPHSHPASGTAVDSLVLPAATPEFLRNVIAAVMGLNAVFLAGTLVFLIFFRRVGSEWRTAPDLKYLLIQFHLGAENVLASWYSSMLLLLVAVAFVWCFVADGAREQPPRATRATRALRFGWLALAAAFVGLSLDEIGSLHERVGTANPLRDYPLNWLDPLALPLLAAAVFIGCFAFVHVARRRVASTLLLGLGAALLLFVAGIEYVEEHLWPVANGFTEHAKPIWYPLIEEGTELLAMTAFLAAALVYLSTGHTAGRSAGAAGTALRVPLRVRGWVATMATAAFVVSLAALYFGVQVLLKHARAGDNGIPHNWFPSALAAMSALGCLVAASRPDHRARRPLYLACAGFLLVLSAYYGAHLRFWLSEIGGRPRSLFEGGLLTIAVLAALALARAGDVRWSRILTYAGGLMLALAIARGGSYPGALDPAAVGLLLVALTTHVTSRRGVEQPASSITSSTLPI
jgi:hypothetical protein